MMVVYLVDLEGDLIEDTFVVEQGWLEEYAICITDVLTFQRLYKDRFSPLSRRPLPWKERLEADGYRIEPLFPIEYIS